MALPSLASKLTSRACPDTGEDETGGWAVGMPWTGREASASARVTPARRLRRQPPSRPRPTPSPSPPHPMSVRVVGQIGTSTKRTMVRMADAPIIGYLLY